MVTASGTESRPNCCIYSGANQTKGFLGEREPKRGYRAVPVFVGSNDGVESHMKPAITPLT